MRGFLTFVLICGVCIDASASCWKVADIKGRSVRAASDFTVGADGFSGQTFEITINGDAGAVKPSNLSCHPVTSNTLVCIHSDEAQAVIETWSINESQRKLVHTKVISGYGSYDGGNLFVGKVIGGCHED